MGDRVAAGYDRSKRVASGRRGGSDQRSERDMLSRVWAGARLGMLLASATAAAAAAQEVVRSPEQIEACLCKEQAVSTLAGKVSEQNRLYEEKRKALDALDKEVQTRRTEINASNPAEVDAFKHLLDERDHAAESFAGEVTRNYSEMVTRYNEAVAAYNASCAGKAYDPDQLDDIRSNLSCPQP